MRSNTYILAHRPHPPPSIASSEPHRTAATPPNFLAFKLQSPPITAFKLQSPPIAAFKLRSPLAAARRRSPPLAAARRRSPPLAAFKFRLPASSFDRSRSRPPNRPGPAFKLRSVPSTSSFRISALRDHRFPPIQPKVLAQEVLVPPLSVLVPTFGSPTVSAFGTSNTPFSFSSTPAFGQSASAFGSTPFGASPYPFGAQGSPFGAQATTPSLSNPGFEQSAFGLSLEEQELHHIAQHLRLMVALVVSLLASWNP
ncbi:uncharacterized protein LOC141823746 [Curcuma longa]|uniref:uncharacterized protein LOC141823746 n=1 Tax=Curcuma longa TaxID=136217 RepID=UPI003D9F994F